MSSHIRYRHSIQSAAWSSEVGRWHLDGHPPCRRQSEWVEFTASFLWMCQGYYRHAEGYMPEWQGWIDSKAASCIRRRGPMTSTRRKKVVVIGSGATAATLIPAMPTSARRHDAQRSPTFFNTGRNANDLADTLRQLDIPPNGRTRSFDARCCSTRPPSLAAA